MGIGSWWKRLMKREDDAAIEHSQERAHETLDEERVTSGDMAGLQANEFAARSVHEGNIEDAERFAKDDDGP